MNCSSCPHGPRSPLSDICDGCTCDPDTGWGGFTDHSVNRHFNTVKEQQDYMDNLTDEEEEI